MLNKKETEELTYRELKEMLPDTEKYRRIPFPAQLRKSGIKVVLSYGMTDWRIEVYENGLYIYASGGRETAYAVDRCSEIEYRFDEQTTRVAEESFGSCKWYIPLVQKGESRLMVNSDKENERAVEFHITTENEGWTEKYTFNPYEELSELKERLKDGKRIRRAFLRLTERQKQAVKLYLKNEAKSKEERLTQSELGEEMGITQQVYSKLLKAAFFRLKKFF